MIRDYRKRLKLGVAESRAIVSVPTPRPARGTAFPRRQLAVRGTPTFELNLWCGTCPSLARRLSDASTLRLGEANRHLDAGLTSIEESVLRTYSRLLPRSDYTALLLDISPQLVEAGAEADYFTHEQIDTWGDDASEDSAGGVSPYYRTFETPAGADGHLYELIVPMIPPSWNDTSRVEHYMAAEGLETATAVAYSLLDVIAPAMEVGDDCYEHWVLTHFLLDGHHKIEAAARAGRDVRLLALVDHRASIASPEELSALIRHRSAPRKTRSRQP